MKILIVSDAWHPQVNGVVRTLEFTQRELQNLGHEVKIAGPAERWCTVAAPTYPSIRLEFLARARLRRLREEFCPDFVHIATEGPLGWAARNMCLQGRLPFTTSYHTRFPEYAEKRVPVWLRRGMRVLAYAFLRRFHAPSSAIMVATASLEDELRGRKFRRLARWSRGVDTDLFRPYGKEIESYTTLPRPILLYVGRVAIEKNLRAFLALDTPGTKVVIGDGPDFMILKREFPRACFLGSMEGTRLARHYAAADLFVFPSTTDTFGLVLLEACAAGLKIASYPAPGPVDLFANDAARNFAFLDQNLGQAIRRALVAECNPEMPRRFAKGFSWPVCTQQFFDNLQAPTPKAVKRITRLRAWLGRWWRHALNFIFSRPISY